MRWASPEMAFNSIVRPDGVHFSVVAQRLATEGKWTVLTGNAELPARTLPGESLVQAAGQWLNVGHLGNGIGIVWLTSAFVILLAGYLARRFAGLSAAWVAVLLLALSPLHAWYSRQLMSEIPWGGIVLFSCGLLAIAGSRPLWICVAGFVGGLGLLFKSSHLLVIMGMFIGWLIAARRTGLSIPRLFGFLLIGAALGAAPAFLYNHAVLGGWLRTAYHVYWPGWASATEALNLKYIWSAPLIKGQMGNAPYYILSLLGLDPRPERMFLLPGLALALGWFIWRSFKSNSSSATDPSAFTFNTLSWCVGLLYGGGCLLYSFQDPRFWLPVVPLVLTSIAGPIARGLPDSERATQAGVRAGQLVLALLMALGVAIVLTETTSNRIPEEQLLRNLAKASASYDVLVSDEDPVLLTHFGVWNSHTRILPLLLPGELWFPDDPADLYRREKVAVSPFIGTVPLVRSALQNGKRVAAYIRRPHDRPEAWLRFQDAFTFIPAGDKTLPWLVQISDKESPANTRHAPTNTGGGTVPAELHKPAVEQPLYFQGAKMPEGFTARERALPPHRVELSPFTLAPSETDQASFVRFLNDSFKAAHLRCEAADSDTSVFWHGNTGEDRLICVLRANEPNLRVVFDRSLDAPFTCDKAPPTLSAPLPMVLVSWYGAILYCNWMSRQEGLLPCYDETNFRRFFPTNGGYRLPTEAEWEQTATWDGSRKHRYAWGDEWDSSLGNVADSPRPALDIPVPLTVPAQLAAPWTPTNAPKSACLHLTGNVWEWCEDWYSDYSEDQQRDPAGPPTGSVKVVRGGSYRTHQESGWSAFRGVATPETVTPDIGFRWARSRPTARP